jgi:hypothetical protein
MGESPAISMQVHRDRATLPRSTFGETAAWIEIAALSPNGFVLPV